MVPSLERLYRNTEGQEVLLQAAQGGRDPLVSQIARRRRQLELIADLSSLRMPPDALGSSYPLDCLPLDLVSISRGPRLLFERIH